MTTTTTAETAASAQPTGSVGIAGEALGAPRAAAEAATSGTVMPAATGTLAATAAAKVLSRPVLWGILIAVVIADALDLMDSTLTTIAAPSIAADLGGGATLIKWLGSAYALALGVLLVLGGRLGDKFGHRRTFLVGIAGFTAASLVCGLAPTPGVIVAGRLLQGAFGALLIPQGMAIMTSVFPREFLGKAFSFFGPMMGVASVGGPILGAFIIDANIGGLGWRPMFLLNIVLGGAGFILARRVLPEIDRDRSLKLDGVGVGLLAGGMFCLVYGLIEGSEHNWPIADIALIVAGVVFFGGFAWRQKTSADPIIVPSLLRNRGFTAGLVIALAFFSVVTGLTYVASLFMQSAGGLTPVQTAIRGITPMALGIIASSFGAAPLMKKLGRNLVFTGLAITFAGALLLIATVNSAGTTIGPWTIAAPMFVVGLGMGTCFGTLFDFALGDVAPAEAGSASGSLSAVQQLAGAIGSAIITTVWFHRLPAGPVPSLTTCLVVVAVISVICCALVFLLPKRAAEVP